MDWIDTDGHGWLETAFGDANADGYYDVVADPHDEGLVAGYAYDTDFNGVYDIFTTEVTDEVIADPLSWDAAWDSQDLGTVEPVLDPVWTLPSPW